MDGVTSKLENTTFALNQINFFSRAKILTLIRLIALLYRCILIFCTVEAVQTAALKKKKQRERESE